MVCDDYDLCSKCEAEGKHPGHNMVRIAAPDTVWPKNLFKRTHKMHERAEARSKCRSNFKENKGQEVPSPGDHAPPPSHGHGQNATPPNGGQWGPFPRGRGMFRGRGRGFGMGSGCAFGGPASSWSNGGPGSWSFSNNGFAAPAFEAMMKGWTGESFAGQQKQDHGSETSF